MSRSGYRAVMFETLSDLSHVEMIAFTAMAGPDRMLVPFEAGADVPFPIRRVFTINADKAGLVGGRHAHRRCSQLLVCLSGSCDVISRVDGSGRVRVDRLDRPDRGLLIPPGIWAEQHYRDDRTVLMVLCDEGYDPTDYIRDFDQFERFRGLAAFVAA